MSAADARQLVTAFFRRHGIQSISLAQMDGITEAYRVCDLHIDFAGDDKHDAYSAQFKLQGDEAGIGDVIRKMRDTGELQLASKHSEQLSLDELLKSFFLRIESRVAKVRQEQSVQSVTFLGNSFRLNGKAVFTVVKDLEGRLDIELHKGDERQAAVLLASSLLDGLYDGSIELLD